MTPPIRLRRFQSIQDDLDREYVETKATRRERVRMMHRSREKAAGCEAAWGRGK